MYLNDVGIIANNCWAIIPDHFINVTLGEFVIMPNHVHGIIIINDPVETGHALFPNADTNQHDQQTGHTLSPNADTNQHDQQRGHALSPNADTNQHDQQTGHALSLNANTIQNDLPEQVPSNETGHALSLHQQPHFRFQNPGKNTISTMVGSFKSAVTKLSKPINLEFGWQSRFHDHIIRSHDSFLRISNYITTNPANWNNDRFYR